MKILCYRYKVEPFAIFFDNENYYNDAQAINRVLSDIGSRFKIELGLISYLKDMELYDINEVNLDDMIMIRLKTNRKYI